MHLSNESLSHRGSYVSGLEGEDEGGVRDDGISGGNNTGFERVGGTHRHSLVDLYQTCFERWRDGKIGRREGEGRETTKRNDDDDHRPLLPLHSPRTLAPIMSFFSGIFNYFWDVLASFGESSPVSSLVLINSISLTPISHSIDPVNRSRQQGTY